MAGSSKKVVSRKSSTASSGRKASKPRTPRKKTGRKYNCVGDSTRKYATKGRSPKSRGLCPRSLPISTVAVGSDDQQWIVMLDSRGEHVWERRRYPVVHPRTPYEEFFRLPTVTRTFGGA
jgi:hypothetical protein